MGEKRPNMLNNALESEADMTDDGRMKVNERSQDKGNLNHLIAEHLN